MPSSCLCAPRPPPQKLAERLEARGYAAAAMNGDMAQKQTGNSTVERLKKGSLDILVATDVAARGLDVERISHVVNYDIPYDTEAYIHRIGRTGRAGRQGDAILFVAPRERRMLSAIEKGDPAEDRATETAQRPRWSTTSASPPSNRPSPTPSPPATWMFMQGLLEQYQQEHDVPALEIAAALAQNDPSVIKPLLLKPEKPRSAPAVMPGQGPNPGNARNGVSRANDRNGVTRASAGRQTATPTRGMERFRIEVGRQHDVKPGNIVGAIANEAGLDAKFIGHIDIQDNYSFVGLPKDMPQDVFLDLKKTRVCGQRLNISRAEQEGMKPPRRKKGRKK